MVTSVIIKQGNKQKRPNTSLDQASYKEAQVLTRTDCVLRTVLGPSDSRNLSPFLYQFCQLLLGLQWKSLEAGFLCSLSTSCSSDQLCSVQSAQPQQDTVTNQSALKEPLHFYLTLLSVCSLPRPCPFLYNLCIIR